MQPIFCLDLMLFGCVLGLFVLIPSFVEFLESVSLALAMIATVWLSIFVVNFGYDCYCLVVYICSELWL
jgi:hypothetical protein